MKTIDKKDPPSNQKPLFYFDFHTKHSLLTINYPNRHLAIDGGPGCGKSASIIKPIIYQCAQRQYPGIIYDFNGDPGEPGLPDLCNTAYASILKNHKEYELNNENYKLKFAFLNFVDVSKSVRINLLSDRYIKSFPDIKDLIINLFKNFLQSPSEKPNFLNEYVTTYIYAVAYMLWKNYRDKGYATLPHVISTCLSDFDTVLNFCSSDLEIKTLMGMLISANVQVPSTKYSKLTSKELSPLKELYDQKIFWVLSADEFDLDITNKDNPTLLGLANNPQQHCISTVISCILSTVMKKMNSPGKEPSVFIIDELPTVYIHKLDYFMSTCRSNNVAAILSWQDYSQLQRDYGKDRAMVIKSNCSNYFQGMTTNPETAKSFVELFGDISQTGKPNIKKFFTLPFLKSNDIKIVLRPSDVMNQNLGHFMGIIKGNEAPFFSTQMIYKEYEKVQVPSFANKYNTGNIKDDNEIMNNLVTNNFMKINDDVQNMLSPFKTMTKKLT